MHYGFYGSISHSIFNMKKINPTAQRKLLRNEFISSSTTIRFSHARSCSHESRTSPSVPRVSKPKKRNQSALRVSDARKFGYKKAFANSKLILPVGVSEHERKFKVKTVPSRTYSEDFDRVDGNPLTARVERRFTTIFVARLLTLQATPLRKKFSKWLSYEGHCH
jgi:hypothetical protein